MDDLLSVFVGFAAEDRYTIAEPIVYHLKNYGIPVWYDRHKLLLGDNRKDKNLIEGVGKPQYACIIISENTKSSICAMEEFAIIKERFLRNEMIVCCILKLVFALSSMDAGAASVKAWKIRRCAWQKMPPS